MHAFRFFPCLPCLQLSSAVQIIPARQGRHSRRLLSGIHRLCFPLLLLPLSAYSAIKKPLANSKNVCHLSASSAFIGFYLWFKCSCLFSCLIRSDPRHQCNPCSINDVSGAQIAFYYFIHSIHCESSPAFILNILPILVNCFCFPLLLFSDFGSRFSDVGSLPQQNRPPRQKYARHAPGHQASEGCGDHRPEAKFGQVFHPRRN